MDRSTVARFSPLNVCGELMTLAEAVRRHGVRGLDSSVVRERLLRGWPLDKALSTPRGAVGRPKKHPPDSR